MDGGSSRVASPRQREKTGRLTSCNAWPQSGTICGFSPGSLKLKERGSRQTGHSFSSSLSWLETTGKGAASMAANGWTAASAVGLAMTTGGEGIFGKLAAEGVLLLIDTPEREAVS